MVQINWKVSRMERNLIFQSQTFGKCPFFFKKQRSQFRVIVWRPKHYLLIIPISAVVRYKTSISPQKLSKQIQNLKFLWLIPKSTVLLIH